MITVRSVAVGIKRKDEYSYGSDGPFACISQTMTL